MYKVLIIYIFILNYSLTYSQVERVYMNSIDEKMKLSPKKVIILISTDWCSYCEVQKKIMKNGNVKVKENPPFYYVEFDAESKDNYLFNGQNYFYNPKMKTHPLAIALNEGNKNMIYPLWVIINENYEIIYKKSAFLKPRSLQQLLDKIQENPSNKY